jgi:hypothetical protein
MSRENRRLEAELAAASREAPAESWKPGDRLGPLALVDGEGTTETLTFERGEGRTLLLLFSPDCPACQAIWPFWEFLVDGAPRGLRVVGLCTGGDPPTARTFPVFTLPDPGRGSLRKVPLVPATLLVDGEGRIVRAWYGVLAAEDETTLLDLVAEISPPQE